MPIRSDDSLGCGGEREPSVGEERIIHLLFFLCNGDVVEKYEVGAQRKDVRTVVKGPRTSPWLALCICKERRGGDGEKDARNEQISDEAN